MPPSLFFVNTCVLVVAWAQSATWDKFVYTIVTYWLRAAGSRIYIATVPT